jgi:hypothetical protein
VRYEVRVVSDESQFEIERDEPPVEGEAIAPGSMVYKVLRVLPRSSVDRAAVGQQL